MLIAYTDLFVLNFKFIFHSNWIKVQSKFKAWSQLPILKVFILKVKDQINNNNYYY